MKYIFTIILLITVRFSLLSQVYNEADLLTIMDRGAKLMYQGKYAEADADFQFVLKNMKSLPSELAFYFGRNSYYLDKHKQAINWLNKYIELKGTKGQYFDETITLLESANAKFAPVRESEVENILTELTKENPIPCPTGRMLCPVCKGSGVLIKKGTFENTYQTCPYSGGNGYLTCEEYNLFLRGELEVKRGN